MVETKRRPKASEGLANWRRWLYHAHKAIPKPSQSNVTTPSATASGQNKLPPIRPRGEGDAGPANDQGRARERR